MTHQLDNFNHQGDLTDILRAPAAPSDPPPDSWSFPATFSPLDDFGDPFTHLGDPLLHDPVAPPFFCPPDRPLKDQTAPFLTAGNVSFASLDDHHIKRPTFFSRMLQISPAAKAPLPLPPSESAQRVLKGHGVQISSPRNTGIRRRKSQAKKVVCIPAPAPANSRSSGEIVPSDLWAWRKYGQKPIKGSPYPRGYYRCSSSKGCSARKQVERSRTDPNMLVITYTSEHNHPWPTQRNALAGSTRTPPPPKTPKPHKPEITPLPSTSAAVKEDTNMEEDEGFPASYRPALPESEDSFFADLGEIEADSLEQLLLFDDRESKGLDPFSFYDWGETNAAAAAAAEPSPDSS